MFRNIMLYECEILILKKALYIRYLSGYKVIHTKGLVEAVYPWASVSIDEPYYDEHFSESFYDVYTDAYIATNEIYPYAVEMGEIGMYRLELKLNALGYSFLKVFEYLDQ